MEIKIPEKLKEAIQQDNLVLFIGAGCSIPLGFPSWKNLVVGILDKLDENHGGNSDINFKNISNKVKSEKTSIFEALNKIESDKNTKTQYKSESKQIINKNIDLIDLSSQDSPVHSLLWEVTTKIVTTNYDRVLENFKPDNKDIKIFENQNRFQSLKSQQSDSQFLYKIHGDFENPETIILFESDYKEIYNSKNHNQDTLSAFFKGKTLLFVGFSLSDPFVTELFDNIKLIYNRFSINTHFSFSTNDDDFSRYDVQTIKINDWNEDLKNYLEQLKKIKIDSRSLVNKEEVIFEQEQIEDLNSLNELIKNKIKELKKNPSDVKLISEINDIRGKIDKSIFGEIDYLQKIDINYKNTELHSLFDAIYSSEKFDKNIIERINLIRSDYKNYHWYDRSVILSALTCSLIHFNKADEQKINLIIDFINDNENKIWQKAITSLFMVLNHLGNKWLRFPHITKKLENLKQIPQIQIACSQIIELFNMGFHNVSFLDEKIFENNYFKEKPFNYFLPFFADKDNHGFIQIYENFDGDINSFIDFLSDSPLPDQLKYLFCNSKFLENSDKKKSKSLKKSTRDILQLNSFFYPYSAYIHELINFYKYFPEFQHQEKLKYHLKITETPIKDHLLNEVESHKALASHFMKQKQWGQAIVNLLDADKLNSNNIEILINLANCYSNMKDYDRELSLRLKIDIIDNMNVQNIEDLYSLYNINKKYKKCVETAARLIDCDNQNDMYFGLRADSYYELEDNINALADYARAICLNPSISSYYYNRSYIYLHTNDFVNAERDILKARELKQNEIDICNFYANYYRLTEDFDKAFENIDKALEIDNNPILIGTKAVIFSSIGNDDEFYFYLENAIKDGAEANRLFPDIKEKYKNEPQFKNLLIKYNQEI